MAYRGRHHMASHTFMASCALLMTATMLAHTAADGTCNTVTRLNATSFHGDIGHTTQVASADACCDECASKPGCQIWTFNVRASTCYLRPAGVHTFSNADAVSGFTSSFVPTPPPTVPPTPAPTPPAPAPNPCRTCRGPVWTWDVFPAFFHSSDKAGPGGGFTPEALETIQRFPMVTIEKW